MAIAVATSRQALADAYKALGNWIGVATGDPGTTNTPANEVVGGTPAYARKQTTWTSGSGGALTGTAATVDVPAGTFTHVLLASAATGATMVDKADVTDVTMSLQGQLIVSATYAQT
jgi:hypothetical protein